MIKKLIYWIKPPCAKCPYTLGKVKFIYNPCHTCKMDNYKMYQMLIEGKYKHPQENGFEKKPKQE